VATRKDHRVAASPAKRRDSDVGVGIDRGEECRQYAGWDWLID
jgi:hypothetical protein